MFFMIFLKIKKAGTDIQNRLLRVMYFMKSCASYNLFPDILLPEQCSNLRQQQHIIGIVEVMDFISCCFLLFCINDC